MPGSASRRNCARSHGAYEYAPTGRRLARRQKCWVTVQTQALKQMMSLARMLKLTPLARRSNPSRPGKPQPMSYYDQMRLEREQEGET
jgi:phage terminase small subunit